jgi:SAM-dependent methyltransferase
MPPYSRFARHYDAVTGADPLHNGARVRGYLDRYVPGAASLLELGCGSGQILAALDDLPVLVGIDGSPAMLARARARVPRATLIEARIDAFELDARFDAVICVFDTLNHLPAPARWRALFARVARHLRPGGVFAFDVNTRGQLARLAQAPPWSLEVPGATVTQRVEWSGDGPATWHVRIDEQGARHDERIHQLAMPLAWIARALRDDFELLESRDDAGAPATDDSTRAYQAWRRRG